MDRRLFLAGSGLSSLMLIAGPCKFLTPSAVAENSDVQAAFEARTEAEVLTALFGVNRSEPSDRIMLSVPFATGAALDAQVKVSSNLEDARSIAITIDKAEYPLAAYVKLHRARCFFSTHIQISETARVSALVQTSGGIFSASKIVKVSGGGYGMFAL